MPQPSRDPLRVSAPDPKSDPRLIISDPVDEPRLMRVSWGTADILAEKNTHSVMTSQALTGELVHVHEEDGEVSLIQCLRDRYVGWVSNHVLTEPLSADTHTITAPQTFAFTKPDLKSVPVGARYLGSTFRTAQEDGKFIEDELGGWIPTQHASPEGVLSDDPATVAEAFVGTPYLWGGRTYNGIDCSGLTVAAYGACGVLLPRDSDMQFAWSGTDIENWSEPGALMRGDLVFWRGHVGIMTDPDTLLHANAYHMATAKEPIAGAIERIANRYGEPIGARRIDLTIGRDRPAWMDA